MRQILSPSQRVANALRRAETAMRDWQDDPDGPRGDVDRMLAIMGDLRLWVQGHVIADVEHAELIHHERTAARSYGGSISASSHDLHSFPDSPLF